MEDRPEEQSAERPARNLVFTRAAARAFRRMPKETENLIRGKLRQVADDPASLATNVKALKGGEKHYRLRIGDYRVIFTIEADQVIVHDVGPRGSIYR